MAKWNQIKFRESVRLPRADTAMYVKLGGAQGYTAKLEGPFICIECPEFKPETSVRKDHSEPIGSVLVPLSNVLYIEQAYEAPAPHPAKK
jgi:hypothetical protein